MRAIALALASLALACRLEPPPEHQTATSTATPTATTTPTTTPTPTSTPTSTPTPTPTSTSTPTSTPAATPAATLTPTAPPPIAPVPVPAPPSAAILLRAASAIEPAGKVQLGDTETVIDPASTFELELGARCPDARLVLVDGQDALVAATSARDLRDTTTLTLAPASPLRPGSRYVLRVDGIASRELHDAYGRAFGPLSRPLLVAGTPPPPEPKKPARRRRR